MKAKLFIITGMLSLSHFVFAQEDAWESQKNITGYIATQADYFPDIKGFDRNYGVNLSEAGILASYKPLKQLTIKSVVVYKPGYSIDQIINEASAEWHFTDIFNVKAGRFLTPLSPINTFYYAPVNNSVSLPMIISNHMAFPINVECVSLNGKVGETYKFEYETFIGGYKNSVSLASGPLSFFGTEDSYFAQLSDTSNKTASSSEINANLNFCKGGHIGFGYLDYIQIGLNVFSGNEKAKMTDPVTNVISTNNIDKTSYGVTAKLKYNALTLMGEYWKHSLKSSGNHSLLKAHGGFCELDYSIGMFTPYARFESEEAINETYFKRYTAGVNFKPIFETIFKLEYMHYTYKSTKLNGIVGSIIYSF